MTSPYTSVAIANFNASPPPDDGSQVESNQLDWDTHLNKLATPLKNAIEGINTNVAAAFTSIYGPTTTETSSGVSLVNCQYLPGDVRRYGAVGDGVADDSTAIANAITAAPTNGRVFGHSEDTYNFGTLAGDAIKFTVTKNIKIDWRGAKLKIAGTDGAFVSDTLFKFLDCVCDMRNYTFEDTTFANATSTSRGVMPVQISNATISTQGHRVGPCHVISGQSLLTCTTTDLTKRASDIQMVGPCTGVDCYYGLNLADNGDQLQGAYSVDEFRRLIFIYGVDNVDVDCHGGANSTASSSDILISRLTRDTSNIKIRAVLDVINGLIRLTDNFDSSAGNGIFTNIDLDLHVKAYGSNLPATSSVIIAIGTDSAAGFKATSNVRMDNIKIDFKSDVIPDNPIVSQTVTPNYGLLETPTIGPTFYTQVAGFLHKTGSNYRKGVASSTLEVAITAITKTNPAVVSAASHGFAAGDVIGIIGGDMTEVNDRVFTVANPNAGDFELSGEDSTGHTTYTTGGTAHATVDFELDDITYNIATSLWAFAVDSIGRFDTSFSGQKTAVEHWSIHGYTDSSQDIAITAQNKAYLSQSGGDSPLGQFIAPDSGSVLYAIMGGYVTTTGALTLNMRHLG